MKLSTYLTYLGLTLIVVGIVLTVASFTLSLTKVEGFIGASCIVIFFIPICFTTQTEAIANVITYAVITLFIVFFAIVTYIMFKFMKAVT